jgi:ABC-type Fe3+/spermidine/putrescine transport system ATPase subunit
MRRGRIEQIGAPRSVYTQPASPFVARFLGHTNLIPAQRAEEGVMTPFGLFTMDLHASPDAPQQQMTLLLRPEAARLTHAVGDLPEGFHRWGENAQVNLLRGRLRAATYHGDAYRIEISVRPQFGQAEEPAELRFVLPTYQCMGSSASLEALQLPPKGDPIALLVATNLTTLLPYGGDAPA